MPSRSLTLPSTLSLSRDPARLPASGVLRRVDRRRVPTVAVVTTAVIACLGLLLGLEATAVGSRSPPPPRLVSDGGAGRGAGVRGGWRPAGLGAARARGAAFVNVAAVAWLALETVNI